MEQDKPLEELKPLFKSHLSVGHITLHSNSDVNVKDSSIQEEGERSGSDDNKENSTRENSVCMSTRSSEDIDGNINNKQNSLPDLRTKDKCKRVTRSCSHGDTQLKSSIASTNLLLASTSFAHRKDRADTQRHHSSDNVLAVSKRTKRAPTVENGIHVLEVN